MTKENRRGPAARLSLTMAAGMRKEAELFSSLLRPGFSVRARVGCSIRELLCEQFGIAPDYLTHRITTIFLNSKAIDDPGSSRVADGAVLALSAAMPGLVGATMRCGGYYAAMRGAMTHHESGEDRRTDIGEVRIKLFNLVMSELAPAFLRRGVGVAPADLTDFLAGQPPGFWTGCRTVLLDGRPVDPGFLAAGNWIAGEDEPVELTVEFEE